MDLPMWVLVPLVVAVVALSGLTLWICVSGMIDSVRNPQPFE